jgi:NAD(P)H-dependent flavin oxidoreductase YrpB (nitropropane dioxygenase family)
LRSRISERFGLDFPLFAFTTSRAVCAAVSRAGGMGIFGAIPYSPDKLEEHLSWIDAHVEGRPYGVDVVMPASYVRAGASGVDRQALAELVPAAHARFAAELLTQHQVPELPGGVHAHSGIVAWSHENSQPQIDVALRHPIKLLVNALGPPPPWAIEQAHVAGVLVGALCGSVEHARKQVASGVDIIVAQGHEAGGHTGEISTLVLVPDVVDAVHPVPVLAAGGIGSGRQMAAALALGADGVWTGSIWLLASENETITPALREKLLLASAQDTVRSRALTGKPARQLRTAWTEAWDGKDSPGPLPMPLQYLATAEAQTRIQYWAAHEHTGARELLGSPVGEIVGRMNRIRPAEQICNELFKECEAVLSQMADRLQAERPVPKNCARAETR